MAGEFVAAKKYEHAGVKIEIGAVDNHPAVSVDGTVITVDVHVETRQYVNPLVPFETHGTLEDVANAIADARKG